MPGAGVVGLALVAVALAGCSQAAAIAPVGGSRLAEVRYAAIDVLAAADVEILEAPVCAEDPNHTVACTGATLDGKKITATSAAADTATVVVTVDGTTIFDGSIHDVLEKGSSR